MRNKVHHYRIVKICGGKYPGIYVQKRVGFLFFRWWRYVVDENHFPDNFYRIVMKFDTMEQAARHIKYLMTLDEPIKKMIL